MGSSMLWIPVMLGGVVVVGVLAVVLLFRLRPQVKGLSSEEREEMAGAPMPRQQKRAWWGLLISLATLSVISTILFSRGAAEYWVNDDLRLLVVGIFLGGLFAYMGTVLPAIAGVHRGGGMDEVDRLVLSRTPNVQSGAVLVTLAAWLTALPKMFHQEGAVPVVYLYLMFGSVILVTMIAQSAGILLGYWFVARHAQG